MPDRIDSIEERLRAVESSIIELATMAKMMRALVVVVALGLGVDITGVSL